MTATAINDHTIPHPDLAPLATRLTALEQRIRQTEADHAAVADAYHQRFRALYRHHQNRIEAHLQFHNDAIARQCIEQAVAEFDEVPASGELSNAR